MFGGDVFVVVRNVVLDASLGVQGYDVVDAVAADDKSILRVVGVGSDGWDDCAVGDCSNSLVVGVFVTKWSCVVGGALGAFGGVLVD